MSTRRTLATAVASTMVATTLGVLGPAAVEAATASAAKPRAAACKHISCCPKRLGPERRRCLLRTKAYQVKIRGESYRFR